MMVALFNEFASTMIYLIYDEKSLLFTNEELVNISSCNVFMSSLTKLKPFIEFLVYHWILLLSSFVVFLLRLIIWAT